jgi:hypothetical protein
VARRTLSREIPRLEPDDGFVDRLAQLAAASSPTPGGVVVPTAFGRPAARTAAAAVAVAALTAGAAAAATHLPHPEHTSPTRQIYPIGTPSANDAGRRHHDRRSAADAPTEATVEGTLHRSDQQSVTSPGHAGPSWPAHSAPWLHGAPWDGHGYDHGDEHGHDREYGDEHGHDAADVWSDRWGPRHRSPIAQHGDSGWTDRGRWHDGDSGDDAWCDHGPGTPGADPNGAGH